jgi:hypothetical protein
MWWGRKDLAAGSKAMTLSGVELTQVITDAWSTMVYSSHPPTRKKLDDIAESIKGGKEW